jgi:hypothetical protein
MSGRVLLITPKFYGIEKKIKSSLEDSGYEVIWIENKILLLDYHGTESKFKSLRRIYFWLCSPQVRYVRKELKKYGNNKFDILFVINAHIVCSFLFKKLKDNNPQLLSILYLWDSCSKFNWTREVKLFDRVYTFDLSDSVKFKIEYKPNFYINPFLKIDNSHKYDLFFVGKFSPERLYILDRITNKTDLNFFIRLWPAYKIYCHNRYVYRILSRLYYKGTWKEKYLLNFEAVEGILKREYLVTESINYDEVQSDMIRSNVILDLPFKKQTGYTHRLIEAIANGKKVLTTNSNIRKEIFYNPEQIHILDDEDPEVDLNWIKNISEFTVDSSFHNLELSNWLKSIINVRIT